MIGILRSSLGICQLDLCFNLVAWTRTTHGAVIIWRCSRDNGDEECRATGLTLCRLCGSAVSLRTSRGRRKSKVLFHFHQWVVPVLSRKCPENPLGLPVCLSVESPNKCAWHCVSAYAKKLRIALITSLLPYRQHRFALLKACVLCCD